MRAAAILGPGITEKSLRPFRAIDNTIDWTSNPTAADVTLIFGGDGTLHRHLPKIVQQKKPILIVPTGSGNDFARALNLHTPKDSLAAWKKFAADKTNVRTIDLGVITSQQEAAQQTAGPSTTHYFATVAGLGLDAEVARRANNLPRWIRGNGGYALSLIPALTHLAPFQMKIETREGNSAPFPGAWQLRSAQPTILAAFANTPTYGSGMKIAPNARLDDAQLDICIIGGIDPFKLFCLFPTVYFGRHTKIGEVDYLRAAAARIETEHPLDIYADGEYVCQTPAEIGVAPAALPVITV